jgi:membrane protein required for colicin V production
MPELGLDWFFVAVLLGSLALGAWRGLVYEVLSLLNWIAAFVLAQWLAPEVAPRLPMGGASTPIQYAAAFVLVFVVSVFAGGLLAKLIRHLFAAVGLQTVDRVLGAVFGLIRGVLVLLAATVLICLTPMVNSSWWKESMGVGLTLAVLQGLKPVLPQEFGKYLP